MKRAIAIVVAAGSLIGVSANAATIIGAAQKAGEFTKLLAAGKAAGVDKALNGKGPFTIFAPNDAAFAKVPKAKLDMLMKPSNREALKTVLGAHLLPGLLSMQAIDKGLAKEPAVVAITVNNMPLVFKREGGMLTVNGAKIIKPPMRVDNGLVYVIDTVLLPPMPLQPTY
jgi:uncharacterized surface protein with fasciclin (FAS1) repeats